MESATFKITTCTSFINDVQQQHFTSRSNLWKHTYLFPFFLLGEIEKPCVLELVDDTEYEEEEELRLVLGSPKSESPFGASVGKQNETLIKIKDDADSKNTLLV